MKARNVLVFPAGTEIGLEIFNALRGCKETQVFGAGQAVSNPAQLVFDDYHLLPNISEPGWLTALVALCQRLQIDYIYPAYDDVIVALQDVTEQLSCAVIAASAETCRITRSKSQTYRALHGCVKVPRVFAEPAQVERFPVFVKPDRGQGSQGATRADDAKALEIACAAVSEPLICEYLPGEEFTVDCFSDRERGLLFAAARRRVRMRNGIAVNSVSEDLPGIERIAAAIGDRLRMRGPWFFQVKRAEDGELTLLEVAPRIAGSMALNRVRGVNFPLLGIYEHERLPLGLLTYAGSVEIDRALANRYRHSIEFSVAYIDLDDTLILRGEVNLPVLALIFQCLNRGIGVKLITRHRFDVQATLSQYRLAGIFDEVIHIVDGRPKSAFIKEADAILVDDSFAERLDVTRQCGIHTFDCSMIEMLLNAPAPARV
ncbi:ATP-grasp domain-containing protein [Pseudomonas sp. RIT-PI-S]|uniref:ATP-grasp domain-containing protein n=1 Tax=Pseudomonas sp. RIT-PI-S TaxID=3035295 RepID=UPI0021DB1619|nr:ATP-grasp domain-containing protein [Pseudomonas sp. RIT-PI-S]